MTAASDQSNCKEVFGTALYTSVRPNSSIPSPTEGEYTFFSLQPVVASCPRKSPHLQDLGLLQIKTDRKWQLDTFDRQ